MTSRTSSSSPPVIWGSHHGIRVRGSVFTLARGRGQLPHLRHDALAVPLPDRADRDPRVDHPRLEPEAGGDETQGADGGPLRQAVVPPGHAVWSPARGTSRLYIPPPG